MGADGRQPSGFRRLALALGLFTFGAAGCALPWVDGDPDAADTVGRGRDFAAEARFADGQQGQRRAEGPSSSNDSDPSAQEGDPSAGGAGSRGDGSVADASADGTADRDEPEAAEPPAVTPGSSASPGPVPAPGPGEPPPDDAASGDAPASTTTHPPGSARLVRIADAGGDVDRGVPGWADVVAVELVDDGSGHLSAHVDVGAAIPRRLEDGEVAGVGIDLYTSGGSESDHQFFLDGSADGWFAYLHTDGELVTYPGTFSIDGTRFTATVPWRSIAGAREGEVAVFADWSTRQVAGLLATSSQDLAPDQGREPYG